MAGLIPVTFRQTTLFLIEDEGRPFAAMKPIALGMGLSWVACRARLLVEQTRWGTREIQVAPSTGDVAVLCLPLHKLGAWLTTVRPYHAKPSRREECRAFQAECDDLLCEVWNQHWAPAEGRQVDLAPNVSPPAAQELSMSPERPSLVIAEVAIRQDARGRFCLNDLHKASGGEQRHRPKYWLENQQTLELVAELSKGGIPPLEGSQPVVTVKGGNAAGTYVAKELVYAYTMWISPAFHLKVIRTFDAVTAGALDPAVSQAPEPTPSLMPELQIAQTAAAMLRLSEPSKIRMLAEICRLRGVASSFLPDYVDEPLVRSLSSLLKEHGSRLSAQTANQALVELGLLETLARPGSKGATKRFRSLTDAGLAYGRNETAPQNPRETQPLYYVHRFAELLARLERHLGQGRDASQPAAAKRRVVH